MMDRNITFLATILFLVLFAGEYHSPVEARGGAGAGARGLARADEITLQRSISRSADNVDQVINETHVNEMTRLSCERGYNENIEALTTSLPHPNATTNSTASKNNTAFIEQWTLEAEKNETNCLIAGPNGGASTFGLSMFSYALCFALYFGFVSLVSPVFFV